MTEEVIDVVDENDMFVRKATREEMRQKALLHRSAKVIIFNNKGELLVQKRSMKKDIYPGYWELGIGETVASGESYESAAIRGLMEEVGIIGLSNLELVRSFLFAQKYRSKINNANYKVYKHEYNGKLKLRQDEVDEVKFLSIEKVKNMIRQELFEPEGVQQLNKYLEIINSKI